MNENLDLTKILEGCPKGTKFYSTIYGEVAFCKIANSKYYPIEFESYSKKLNIRYTYSVTKGGRTDCNFDGECTLFPSKDQRDWSKFERFWDKPEVEKFDPKTLQPFDKVLVKDDYEIWQVEFFSHICQREPEGWCQCSGDVYYFCIPYNEETMPLVGTKEDCPEYYKWWEE